MISSIFEKCQFFQHNKQAAACLTTLANRQEIHFDPVVHSLMHQQQVVCRCRQVWRDYSIKMSIFYILKHVMLAAQVFQTIPKFDIYGLFQLSRQLVPTVRPYTNSGWRSRAQPSCVWSLMLKLMNVYCFSSWLPPWLLTRSFSTSSKVVNYVVISNSIAGREPQRNDQTSLQHQFWTKPSTVIHVLLF